MLPYAEPGFFDYLGALDMSQVKIHCIADGKFVFPGEPLMSLEGPLAAVQVVEATLINLTSYPTLICTNAVRMRIAAGRKKKLVEFGLRRAQGPVGATMGAKYAIIGTFDGIISHLYRSIATSNTLLGQQSGGQVPVYGTMAHSFIVSYTDDSDLGALRKFKGVDIVERAQHYRKELGWMHTNYSELLAFLSYASANEQGFVALVDTYNTLESGVKNFLVVALVLDELGVRAGGIRLDSGDLSELSKYTITGY